VMGWSGPGVFCSRVIGRASFLVELGLV